jgi:hypothetical protein
LSVIGIQSAPDSDNIQSRENLPAPEFCRYRNPAPADQIPAGISADSGQVDRIWTDPVLIRPDLAKTVGIRLLIRPDLAKAGGIRPDLDGSGY